MKDWKCCTFFLHISLAVLFLLAAFGCGSGQDSKVVLSKCSLHVNEMLLQAVNSKKQVGDYSKNLDSISVDVEKLLSNLQASSNDKNSHEIRYVRTCSNLIRIGSKFFQANLRTNDADATITSSLDAGDLAIPKDYTERIRARNNAAKALRAEISNLIAIRELLLSTYSEKDLIDKKIAEDTIQHLGKGSFALSL